MDYLQQLNEKQREAVIETEGYVRVIAGAGSGKTKLLVSRYAYLVQEYGIDSANILCVTFTNKAAGEMKKRIRTLIGEAYDTTLICTYHGFCNRLLRENPEKLFLNKGFQIMDGYHQKAVLGEIYQKYELKLDYASFENIMHKIGQFKTDTSYVARICNPRKCQILPQVVTQDDMIIEDFLQKQKATYSLDFNDLIAFAIYLLETDEEIREKWQDRLNYIMVDEFQDSSSVEMHLIEILSGKYQNLMIVGDPDQNIYEWRGSDVRLLVDFDKGHVPTQTIILNQNYRSTPQILQCANTLIEKNQLRLKKDLFTKAPAGEAVYHYHSKDDYSEMDQVIGQIKELKAREGYRYSDFAILYRSGFLSRIAEKKLVERSIPYEIFGGVRFYQRMEILDVLAYLKVIAFDDDTSLRRIINTPRRRFGRAKMNLLDEIYENGRPPREQLSIFDLPQEDNGEAVRKNSLFGTLAANLDLPEFHSSDIASFVKLIGHLKKASEKMRISEIVNSVCRDSGYEAYIRELGDMERLDNLAEFKRIANEFEREFGENLTLEEFLQQIALQSGEDTDEGKDTVKLMTIHASKGLEFPVVFILGFTEGIFPSSKTIEERKQLGLEEERRLCYVAITRAQKRLFLMDSEGSSPNGIKKLCSRFLEEIGISNYIRIGWISDELQRESRAYSAKLNIGLYVPEKTEIETGKRVTHHIFGKGTVQAVDERKGSFIIKFDKLPQPRTISADYFKKEHQDLRKQLMETVEEVTQEADIPAETDKNTTRKAGIASEAGEKIALEADASSVTAETGELPLETADQDVTGMEPAPETVVPAAELPATEFAPSEHRIDSSNETSEDQLDETVFAIAQEDVEEVSDETEVQAESEGESIVQEHAMEDAAEKPERITAADLQRLKEESPNLWKRDDVPHSGWNCVGVEDLGAPVGICQMCGYQIIRYAHRMTHPKYHPIIAGCVCAGKMEGSIEAAREREAEFKNRQARRINFFRRKWRMSKKGNQFLKIDDHVVVLYRQNGVRELWKYSLDNTFCRDAFETKENAMAAAFEALEKVRRS